MLKSTTIIQEFMNIIHDSNRFARTRKGTDYCSIKIYKVLPEYIKCLEDNKYEDYLKTVLNDFM